MTQEINPASMSEINDDLSPMPTFIPQLSRTFSNYDDPDVKLVEQWLYYGGDKPADEVIQNGFPILYNQIYCEDLHGRSYWSYGHHFTVERKERWEVMESLTGVRPIMNDYQQANYKSQTYTSD
jgi:hypothetical protein